MSRVGDDELAELVLRKVRAEGVDVGGATVDAGAPTSLTTRMTRRVRRAGYPIVLSRRMDIATKSLSAVPR